jgi:hypothetical protein
MQEYIALETQHMIHYCDIKKEAYNDKRHRSDGEFRKRYGAPYDGIGILGDRIRFHSERTPIVKTPDRGRHEVHEISKTALAEQVTARKAAKAAMAAGDNPPTMAEEELGPSIEYHNKVGVAHLDRCWTEQGHPHVSRSLLTPLSPPLTHGSHRAS